MALSPSAAWVVLQSLQGELLPLKSFDILAEAAVLWGAEPQTHSRNSWALCLQLSHLTFLGGFLFGDNVL